MDFEKQLAEAQLCIDSGAEYLGITPRTIYRYMAHGAPLMARRAIAARAGTLNHWSGYRIIDTRIIRADGRVFTRKDLDHFEHWNVKPDFRK